MTPKERILQYIDAKGITQYAFSKKTGLSNGFLKAGSSLSVDNLLIISKVFSDLNLEWVICGEGNMLHDGNIGHIQTGHTNTIDNSPININANTAEIERLNERIKHLEDLLSAKDEIINLLKNK